MRHSFYLCAALALGLLTGAEAANNDTNTGTVWVTPHDSYSSSVGVLGCKIDTNRVAYWPQSVDCNNICVALRYQDREVKLLRIDQSQGAHDVSYDAWNYLYTGYSATKHPTAGGAIEMQFENLDASECDDLINTKGSKLPFSAANSMNFIASCLEQKDSWVGENYVLYNIIDSICTMGFDETCELDFPAMNQPTCPHTLGDQARLTSQPVYNILYPTGEKVKATSGQPPVAGDAGSDDDDAANHLAESHILSVVALMLLLAVYM
ncbi:hypothetical protein NLU13_5413 [Sarocladium strictum]|uniref:Cerato-platanin n=1 Tax=Sarocladium strictum TaxID=5046 RepID=A0AA39GGU8_SARSR|nr:hypothetical protein NLU13_5413 [Sarocladium strictum]